jgi:hypothetical protein
MTVLSSAWASSDRGGSAVSRETAQPSALGSLAVSGRVGAAKRGLPVGALLLRSVFAEAEEVGEGRRLRRAGR